MTTCPSGVHYMHLVDHAREYINDSYQRPVFDRVLRNALALVLPRPGLFRLSMWGARIAKPVSFMMPKILRNMVDFAPTNLSPISANDLPQTFAPKAKKKMRVALMTGCAQKVLNTNINDATIRVLRRLGCEVVVAEGAGCCGALTHHMGKTKSSHGFAAANIKAWKDAEVDAVVINTSGCGTTVKDYGHMFRNDALAEDAKDIAGKAMDISELLCTLDIPQQNKKGMRVAYHAACSLQHGQQVKTAPKDILRKLGYEIVEPTDSHLCCGSAGTYNLLQPDISKELKRRKVDTLEALKPDVIAAGNIGCMMQIGSGTKHPILHTVELVDWALGGPKPRALVDAGH